MPLNWLFSVVMVGFLLVMSYSLYFYWYEMCVDVDGGCVEELNEYWKW